MARILEAVPNFSAGRNAETVARIASAMDVPGVRVADVHADPDHNRMVVTALGTEPALEEALMAAAREAVVRIDLRTHQGVHPFLGAVDVVPIVPLEPEDMPWAIDAAHRFGRRLAEELGLPVFFYEEAALRSEYRSLPAVRQGGLKALTEGMAQGVLLPDAGPALAHPSAGVVVVGARWPLIAYNLLLDTRDREAAWEIARGVRERDGGLPFVRALALPLASREGRYQISMNLIRSTATPLAAVVQRVQQLAAERGIRVLEGELVGLLPFGDLLEAGRRLFLLPDLSRRRLLDPGEEGFA